MDIVDRQPPAPEEAAAFHASLAKFYVEHLHADEEARYILGGGGVWRCTAVAGMKGLGSTEHKTSSLHPRLALICFVPRSQHRRPHLRQLKTITHTCTNHFSLDRLL
jgi:hypothetical protein